MAYVAYVTALKNLRKHPNADRLMLAECFGNTVCVTTEYTEGQVGIYFPTDGQLSEEFATANNLLRKKDENGNNIGGYMDPEKRNVTSIRLRGEKSDGLFLPITCLDYTGVNLNEVHVGDTISVVNGHEICQKYIPHHTKRTSAGGAGTRVHRRAKRSIAPLFFEHADTEQLAYNLSAFNPGDLVEITLKMHGTSQRTAHVPVFKGMATPHPWARFVLNHIQPKGKLSTWLYDAAMDTAHAVYDWDYVSGTRRVVLDTYDGGFYGSNEFRMQHHNMFIGKLRKGETVYYEVVGFTHDGQPIMSSVSNKKLNDKEFVKQYGATTTFSYGCSPKGKEVQYGSDDYGTFALEVEVPQSDVYVYRMTMTNEDGDVVEYTPDFMRYRCEQMGVKTVPVFWYGYIPQDLKTDNFITDENGNFQEWIYAENAGEWVKAKAEEFYDGADPIGKTHVREGVVCRILNRPAFAAYKHKNFAFKVIEGIVKVEAEAPDMEEAQEVSNEE